MQQTFSRRQMLGVGALAGTTVGSMAAAEQPNILWITCEDLSPILGCYGDPYAHTPNLDKLATESVRYTKAFSTASVCTPSRSCLITGVPATAQGTMHLRGVQRLASDVKCFPELLRNAGYYTSNNEKQDYNFEAPAGVWDESSNQAHFRKRKAGQRFFSVFNLMATHQGQIRYSREEFDKITATLQPAERHDPARAPLPPYYPDTPLTRLNMAELYTQTTLMDRQAGRILKELDEDGLAEDTVVFFFSDHGTGLPRGKRWLHDSGTRVPFMVRFPRKYAHLAPGKAGTATDRLVSFEDFAPSVLALAGVPAAGSMRGVPFLGPRAGAPRQYTYFHSDRVDEVLECCRSVRDGRYQYIRNFLPHRPRMQHSTYSELGLVRQELRRLDEAAQLKGDQALLTAATIPAEELYDTQADPHQVRNLAGSTQHRVLLERLRGKLFEWMLETRDTGLLPEPDMMERARGRSPREIDFPCERILRAADLTGRGASKEEKLRALLGDPDAAVRYWAVTGLTVLGKPAETALEDVSISVRIAAAEQALKTNDSAKARTVLEKAILEPDAIVALQAAIVYWYCGERARASAATLRQALTVQGGPQWQRTYAQDAIKKVLARLEKRTG